MVEQRAFFHDGYFWHKHKPKDVRDTLALAQRGYQVVRTRDRLPPVEGALNIDVDASRGFTEICRTLAAALGVADEAWPTLWKCADSLAQRREIADKLLKVTLEVGAVEEIYTDNGHEFINKVVKHLCEAMGIRKYCGKKWAPVGAWCIIQPAGECEGHSVLRFAASAKAATP
ncbi:hypothetical protein JKP88DRAFT_280081 [Tribonema minus]|uniref:Uncharacterized protein n=1 Tax=Tribonema minus TaxID=303371 RepID=A0A836CB94_9STRA|nr:hypothetical protein JKP88DRAFT_280081 [Tribonema minus]